MFRPLILTISSALYRKFKSFTSDEFDDFHHSVLVSAIELVLHDFVPQTYGGQAYFATYLKRKLWLVCLGRARINAEKQMYASETFQYGDYLTIAKGHDSQAIAEEITDIDQTSVNDLAFGEVDKRVADVLMIAQQSLTETEFIIWQYVLLRGSSYTQIAEILKDRDPDSKYTWTKQRVYNAYNSIRQKVMASYGMAVLAGKV